MTASGCSQHRRAAAPAPRLDHAAQRLQYLRVPGRWLQAGRIQRNGVLPACRYVAKNNGYVHMSWWNNLLAPCIRRPLHKKTIRIERLFDTRAARHPDGTRKPVHRSTSSSPCLVRPSSTSQGQPGRRLPVSKRRRPGDQGHQVSQPQRHHRRCGPQHGWRLCRASRRRQDGADRSARANRGGNSRDKPEGMTGTHTANRSRWRRCVRLEGL